MSRHEAEPIIALCCGSPQQRKLVGSSDYRDAVPGAIAIWTLESGQESIYYVAIVHCIGTNQQYAFSYYSASEQKIKSFSVQGLGILKNGRGMFRAFILPHKDKNIPGKPSDSCKI